MTIDYHSPLVETSAEELDVRKAMVANALSVIGLHGGTRDSVPAFQRLLGPPGRWPLHRAYGKGGVSTCAMVCMGLLRRIGVACPEVQDGYAIGSGINEAKRWAKRLSPTAWIRPSQDRERPKPGDIVQILFPMHALTVIGWETAADGQELIVSVDGGQVGLDGLQAVHRCRRPWRDTPMGPTLGVRVVDGWIDVTKLPLSGTTTVPEGWEGVTC